MLAPKLEPIDLITVKKALSDVAEKFRKEQRSAQSLAASDDKHTKVHKAYWESLAVRHGLQADLVDSLWRGLPSDDHLRKPMKGGLDG